MANRVSGIFYVRIDGVQRNAMGNFTYNLGAVKREPVIGADGIHGFSEMPQSPRIEGEITDQSDLDVETMLNLTDTTITLELANGKVIVLSNAYYAGDGDIGTENANVQILFHGLEATEDARG